MRTNNRKVSPILSQRKMHLTKFLFWAEQMILASVLELIKTIS